MTLLLRAISVNNRGSLRRGSHCPVLEFTQGYKFIAYPVKIFRNSITLNEVRNSNKDLRFDGLLIDNIPMWSLWHRLCENPFVVFQEYLYFYFFQYLLFFH